MSGVPWDQPGADPLDEAPPPGTLYAAADAYTRAVRALGAEIAAVLRLEQITAWLNDRLTRRRR